MKQFLLSMTLTAAAVCPVMAQDPFEALSVPPENPTTATQKLIFVPDSLKPYDFNDDNARWCWRHSAQTQNVVYFWEKPFGDDTSNPPLLDGQPMKFDIGNLQNRVSVSTGSSVIL